jgi:hypothetical protein
MWIDYLTYVQQMGLVNLACYMAVKTPLLDHDLILGK